MAFAKQYEGTMIILFLSYVMHLNIERRRLTSSQEKFKSLYLANTTKSQEPIRQSSD